MKKFTFTIICAIASYFSCMAQTMEASIGLGSTSTRIKIYVRPTASLVAGNISSFQFCVGIDDAIIPAPSLSFTAPPAFGSGWVISSSYIEDGYRLYDIVSSNGGPLTLAAGVEMQVMELEFAGGPVTAIDASLITLPGGGIVTSNALFYCTGAAESVEGQLYYTRPGTTVINNASYTGADISIASLGGALLPVNWFSFNAAKQGNDAIINWVVGNEDAASYYELQRSINATTFNTVATINKANTGGRYEYTDAAINNAGTKTVYYRIKQVDANGRANFSDIRMLRFDVKDININIYPNPAIHGFYVSVPLTNPGSKKVKLSLIAPDGQIVSIKEIPATLATNYYFDIKDKKFAAGQYNLQIIYEDSVLANKKIYINQ
jgi:hypothetical protein